MARKNEIKTRLTLEGEQQYKKAMDDAASSIKQLNAEQKLAEAQFRATGDAETYQAERARLLKEQIENQKRIIAETEKALKNMRDNGVEPSQKSYRTMETRLINAKTSLVNMETKLGDVTGSLNTGKQAAGEYGSQLAQIGEGVTLQGAIDAIDRVTGAIKNIARTAAHVMKETWDIMNDAGNWADELITTAQVYEIPVDTLQRWRYAATQVDTDVSTIASAHQRIIKSMSATSEETQLAFNSLNVATRNTNGELRDSYDVFWEVIDALGEIENASERDSIAQGLLGRGYAELLPLINTGRKAWDEYAESAVIVSDGAVTSLGEMDDAFATLEQTITATKYETLAALAPTFEQIADALNTTVTAFNDFLHTEEGQAAMERVSTAITDILNGLTEDVDFEGVVNAAADAIKALGDGLVFISNHRGVIVGAISAIGGTLAALEVSKGVLTVMQLINGGKMIAGRFAGGAAAAAAGGGGAAAGGGGAVASGAASAGGGGLWAGLGSGLSKVGAGIASGAKAVASTIAALAAPAAVGMALGAVGGALLDYTYTQQHYGAANEMNAISEEVINQAESANAARGLTDVFGEISELYAQGLDDQTMPQIMQIIRDNTETLAEALDLETLLDGYDLESEIVDANTKFDAAEFIGRIYAALGERIVDDTAKANVNPSDWAAQRQLWQTFDLALRGGTSPRGMLNMYGSEDIQALLGQAFPDEMDLLGNMNVVDEYTIAERIQALKERLEEDMTAAGLDASTGFTTGISEGTETAAETAAEMAQGAVDAVNTTLDSHSPSKVMYNIGQNVAIGLANGISSQIAAAQAAAARLAAIVASTVALRLAIHSPSRVMEQLGEYTAEGFAAGVMDNIWQVEQAVGRMSSATTRAPIYGGRLSYGGAGADGGGEIHAYIVMDKEIVGEMVAPTVDGWIGAAIRDKR